MLNEARVLEPNANGYPQPDKSISEPDRISRGHVKIGAKDPTTDIYPNEARSEGTRAPRNSSVTLIVSRIGGIMMLKHVESRQVLAGIIIGF